MLPSQDVPTGGVVLDDIDERWDAWRPDEAADRLRVISAPWCVAGGWGLDLWRGEQTREHSDLEIAIPTLPYDYVIGHDAVGIPYLNPGIVLLFKAKHARQKDQADFAAALPLLQPASAAWLRAAPERVHPGHPWIEPL
jgi:hypothetical protein